MRETGPAYAPQRIVVSFGPEHAPLEQRQVAHAIEEAQTLVPKPKLIVFAAFQFDPEASKDIDETNWPGVTLLKAQMNADLLTDDLKKKRATNESFWLIGQPDVQLETITKGDDKGKYRVSVHGFDYYNTKDRRHRIGWGRTDCSLVVRHRLRWAQSLPSPGVLSNGRGERGLGEAGQKSQSRN